MKYFTVFVASDILKLNDIQYFTRFSRYLDFMFEGHNGPIRPQDFRVIYRTLASSPKGISALIEFLTDKLHRIVNEIINGEQVAASIYSLLASRVALDEEILKVNRPCVSFFSTWFAD